jgi:hypothetical protein
MLIDKNNYLINLNNILRSILKKMFIDIVSDIFK